MRDFVDPSISPLVQQSIILKLKMRKRAFLMVQRLSCDCDSVCPFVHLSIHWSNNEKTSVLGVFCVCEWGTWGVDGSWMPLPTHMQRYCDPASLVLYHIENSKPPWRWKQGQHL